MDEPFAQHVGVKAMDQRDRCHGHAGSHASRDDQALKSGLCRRLRRLPSNRFRKCPCVRLSDADARLLRCGLGSI